MQEFRVPVKINKRRGDETFLSKKYQRINVEQIIELENHHIPSQSQLIQPESIRGC